MASIFTLIIPSVKIEVEDEKPEVDRLPQEDLLALAAQTAIDEKKEQHVIDIESEEIKIEEQKGGRRSASRPSKSEFEGLEYTEGDEEDKDDEEAANVVAEKEKQIKKKTKRRFLGSSLSRSSKKKKEKDSKEKSSSSYQLSTTEMAERLSSVKKAPERPEVEGELKYDIISTWFKVLTAEEAQRHPLYKMKPPAGSIVIEVNVKLLVERILDNCNINTRVFLRDPKTDTYQVNFIAFTPLQSQTVLNEMRSNHIGDPGFGSISITSTTFTFPETADYTEPEKSGFMESMKSRHLVQEVLDNIKAGARFTFDFLMLTLVAAILAACGLASDSAVIVVSSMLVSPIMGPVLGVTFGTVMRDCTLFKNAFCVEIGALFTCILVGFVSGLGFAQFSEDLDWPTSEMQSRGTVEALYFGIIQALASGVGVALSVLGGNVGSLVGVAISASLLPPAVNTGLYWAFILIDQDRFTQGELDQFVQESLISFALTAENIACIYVSAMIMFWVKEVAPYPQKSEFWKKDMRVARDFNLHLEKETRRKNIGDNMHVYENYAEIDADYDKTYRSGISVRSDYDKTLRSDYNRTLSIHRARAFAQALKEVGADTIISQTPRKKRKPIPFVAIIPTTDSDSNGSNSDTESTKKSL